MINGNGVFCGRETVTDLGATLSSPLKNDVEELADKDRPLNAPIRFRLIDTVDILFCDRVCFRPI